MGIVSIRKYGWVAVLGLLIAVALVVFLLTYHVPSISQLTFTERVQGMDIKPFHDEVDDVYYLFLPAYVNKEQVDITMPEGVSIHFSANGQDYGSSLARLPLQEPVELSISAPHRQSEKCTIELLQSKNLPTLFIETGEGGAENVLLNKNNKTQAAVVSVNTDGKVDYKGLGKLYGRGNSTWNQAKRPYNLKFNQLVSLNAGADSATNWCLLANYGDDSQIRNIICNYMARKVGVPYTSEMVFVSLYVNGEYQGLYNIATKQSYMADAGKKIKAVFEKTRIDRIHHGASDNNFYFRTRYGNDDDICKAINAFEYALYSGRTSYQQLGQHLDVQAFAEKYIVDAVCGNGDLSFSQYYMVDESDMITPICAWDYDLSFGVSCFYSDFAFNQVVVTHPWINELFNYEEYRKALLYLVAKYDDLVQHELIDYLDWTCMTIENDWALNVIRWRNQPACWNGQGVLLSKNYDYSTLQGHKAYIADFLYKRIKFLYDYWSFPERYCCLTFKADQSKGVRSPKVVLYPKNDTLAKNMLPDGLLTMQDEGFEGWYTKDGTSVTDVGVITEDMSFEERLTPKPRTTALMEKVIHKAWLLILIAVFGCLSLWLFVKAVLIPIKEAKR